MKRFNKLERSIVFILLMNLITQFTLWVVGGGGSGFKMMSSRTMPVDFYASNSHTFELERYDFGELMIFGIVPIFVFLVYCFVFKMKPKPKD